MDILSNPTIKTNQLSNRVIASPTGSSGDMVPRILFAADLPQLDGFTDLAADGVDIFPYYDVGNGANRDCTLDQMLKIGLEGFISGLGMEFVSTKSITIKTGIVYIQSSGRLLRLAADSTVVPSLSASTWYHVYLFLSGSTPTIEVSTTAPDTPFFRTARSKTGATTHRYIGSFRTSANSEIFNFKHTPDTGEVLYIEDSAASPFRVLGPGQSTAQTSVDCSAVVPVTARNCQIRAINFNVGTGAILRTPLLSNQLNGAIDSSTTTFTLNSTDNFRTSGRGIVDNEEFSWTGKTATTLTGITRGDWNTSAASHSNGATVTVALSLLHVNNNTEFVLPYTLSPTQTMAYRIQGGTAPTGGNGFYCDIKGYYYER